MKMGKTVLRIQQAVVVLGVSLFSCWVSAQVNTPSSPDGPSAKGKLDQAYIDGSFGFTLRPPAGSTCDPEKKKLGPANYEIVRFNQPQHDWYLSVRLSQDARPPDARIITDKLITNLKEQYADVELLSQENTRIAGRQAALSAVCFTFGEPVSLTQDKKKQWLHQQAVIQEKPGECFALVLLTSFEDRSIATKTFERIVQSFEFRRTAQQEQHMRKALDRGEKLIQSVAEKKLNLSDHLLKETYLLIKRNGKEIGFLGMQEEPVNVQGHEGVRLYHWNWIFEDDGGISNFNHLMYLSADLKKEEWEYRMQMLTPPGTGVQRKVLLDIESAVRQKDKLLIEYPKKLETMEREDKVLEVGKSYAPAALMSLLPRLVDLNSPELYAFSTYEHDRRGLILRTMEVVGQQQILAKGQSIQAWKLQDSEGLPPPITSIYVDKKGQILRMDVGNMKMTLTTREYVERKFQSRVNEAQKAIQERMEEYQKALRQKMPAPDEEKTKRSDRQKP